MRVEIISIGDELLIGQVVNTNAAWMGRELTQRGFNVVGVTTVGDNSDAIMKAIDLSFQRADVVLLTGGVGPTKDDITKQTLCRYFRTNLEFNDDVLKNIESIFSKRNIQLNLLTRNQAYVPKNSTVIQNRVGTAPILCFNQGGKVLISMPGGPFEMKTSMREEVIPLLLAQFLPEYYLKCSYLVCGITESALATRLATFEEQLPLGFSLAYLPAYGYIRLRLSAWGKSRKLEMKNMDIKLKQLLGNELVADNDQSLEALLGEKLRTLNLSISTAESCTGGYLAHRITSIAGASSYFKGSIVSYDNQVKEELLHVDKQTIENVGAVSQEVVEQMAEQVAFTLKTNCSIAVSGFMGPDGGTLEKPVGTVWICTRFNNKKIAAVHRVGSSREENINRTANMAILQLLRMLGR